MKRWLKQLRARIDTMTGSPSLCRPKCRPKRWFTPRVEPLEDRTLLSTGPLTIDDSADKSSATYTVTSSTVQINGSAPIVYTGATRVILQGGSGADTYNVTSTTTQTPVTINAGAFRA
jgi:hypothetical protein